MNYTLIKGTFHIVGQSPDGDSIKFKANNPARWDEIVTEHRERLEENIAKEDGFVQLRLQGVDALETHYSPPPLSEPKDLKIKVKKKDEIEKPSKKSCEQPSELAQAATDEFMKILGVERTEWRSGWGRTWISKAYIKKGRKEICFDKKYEDEIPGYIVTNDAEKNGRPIAWVFPGKTRSRDGSSLTDAQLAKRLHRSANYLLLKSGLVYPYFYMTLPAKLREKLSEATQYAYEQAEELSKPSSKKAPKVPNLWLYDRTDRGVTLSTLETLTEKYEIFPYLFRRLIKHWYWKNMQSYWQVLEGKGRSSYDPDNHKMDLDGFFDNGNPYVFIVSEMDFVRLDDILQIKGNRLKLTKPPFDIVFLS